MPSEESSATTLGTTEDELLRQAYIAYLITLDPVIAVSAMMTAVKESQQRQTEQAYPGLNHLLLQRMTVKAAISHIRQQIHASLNETSAECRDTFDSRIKGVASSPSSQEFGDSSEEPIGELDVAPRVAFLLHHVLGYSIDESVSLSGIGAPRFQGCLADAYLQLVSRRPTLDSKNSARSL